MENDKKEVKAVHERDLDNLLTKISKKDDFDAGNIKCKFCKTVINNDNLYSLFSESGAIQFICDNPQCIEEFMSHTVNKEVETNKK